MMQKRKEVLFLVDGRQVTIRGGQARLARMMIQEGKEGIDRHMCGEWCADLPSAICRLRTKHGLNIETLRGKPTRYVLRSNVSRDGRKR